ncbi:hypothetical protein N658DRAFT_153658 [Parathielavia hyrcaniae]|uniref:Secreted protein n=1 Tax=Parathielavia hyrcaniae TaxID=113614 RepID=A0AAN6PZ51_9PEZI|nr:hypothetical protein N658DRAFT_153658 [Parathielavia hyrcaniae]
MKASRPPSACFLASWSNCLLVSLISASLVCPPPCVLLRSPSPVITFLTAFVLPACRFWQCPPSSHQPGHLHDSP